MELDPRFLHELRESGVIAVVSIDDPSIIEPLAGALVAGNIKFIEIVFRTKQSLEVLKKLAVTDLRVHAGAGTIRNVEQARDAIVAGARFLVSPGFNLNVADMMKQSSLYYFPGVDSTLGIEHALDSGFHVLKFFPARESGGITWLKAINAPYPDVQFIPTGGITIENMTAYLELPNVVAIGGSFLTPANLIKDRAFNEITKLALKASEIASTVLAGKQHELIR